MNIFKSTLLLITILFSACSVTQSRFTYLDAKYPSLSENAEIEVFQTGAPSRAFTKVARLDVHLEKTYFASSSLKEALPELKKQARRAGANAITDIHERTSKIGETMIYHVTATGIRYSEN